MAVTVVTIAVSLVSASAALALTSKTMTRSNGVAGFADWFNETEEGFDDTFITVVETTSGTDVYYDECHYFFATDEFSCRSGYFFTTTDVFSHDQKLNSAHLMPVEIEVFDWMTGSSEMVMLEASWTGTGELQRGALKVMEKFGDSTFKYNERSSFRDASAVASVDETALGMSTFGGIVKFKAMSMEMVK